MKRRLLVSVLVLFVCCMGLQLSAQTKSGIKPVKAPLLPDLTITKCNAIGKYVMEVTVKNQGTKTSRGCKLLIESSGFDGVFDKEKELRHVVKFKKLSSTPTWTPSGERRNMRTVRITCPFDVYYKTKVRVTIDPVNVVKESREDNNKCVDDNLEM
jgi:hypothetical protein